MDPGGVADDEDEVADQPVGMSLAIVPEGRLHRQFCKTMNVLKRQYLFSMGVLKTMFWHWRNETAMGLAMIAAIKISGGRSFLPTMEFCHCCLARWRVQTITDRTYRLVSPDLLLFGS